MTDSSFAPAPVDDAPGWQQHYTSSRAALLAKRSKSMARATSVSALVGLVVVTIIDPALTTQAPALITLATVIGVSLGMLRRKNTSPGGSVTLIALLALATVLHVEALLVIHVGHEPPKLLLTIIPAVIAMVLPMESREYLPIAFMIPLTHLGFSPFTGSEYILIEIFMIVVSIGFGWLNIHLSTHDRETLSQNAITIAHEQNQLRENNRTLEARVTERTRVAEQRAHELQKLAQEVNRAESRERQLIARTLHDNLQQVIAAARLRLGTIKSESSDKLEDNERECLQDAQSFLNEALETSRTLAVELAPYSLLEEGLPTAISWLSKHFQERHQLELTTVIDTEGHEIQTEVNYFLFHATRELLFNATKHSLSNSAHLSLRSSSNDEISITVKNRTRASLAKSSEAEAKTFKPTFGLPTIQTRAQLMGGTTAISTDEDGLFTVTLTLPRFIDPAQG